MKMTRTVWCAFLLLVSIASPVRAAVVVLTLDLAVESREVGAVYGGTVDPSFVPFNSSATLTFDPTLIESYVSDYTAYGYIATVANFAATNHFTSGLTPLLPWGPPFGMPAHVEYDRAIYVHNTFTDAGADPAENNWLLFDKRHRAVDSAAELDYLHAYALQSRNGTVYPIAPDWSSFGTDDLLAYLTMLMTEQLPMDFIETGFIYDYGSHQMVESVLYRARATISDLAVVPLPSAGLLLGGVMPVLGLLRRRLR